MTRARVLFRYNDTRWFARLVCWARGGDSAHCEAGRTLDPSREYIAVSASFVDGGVRPTYIEADPGKWRVYEMDFAIEPGQWLVNNRRVKYDVLGLLGILWPRFGHSKSRRFCSEAVAEMIGLPNPHLFDLRALEAVCARYGTRVQ